LYNCAILNAVHQYILLYTCKFNWLIVRKNSEEIKDPLIAHILIFAEIFNLLTILRLSTFWYICGVDGVIHIKSPWHCHWQTYVLKVKGLGPLQMFPFSQSTLWVMGTRLPVERKYYERNGSGGERRHKQTNTNGIILIFYIVL
jgi:hypothetical protein